MIRILTVEDEQPISDLLKMSLSRAGYQVTCIYDGLAAADLLEKERFDLILLDVMLPGADGFELMEYISALHIPVVFITAKGDVSDRIKGLRMGAEDYICKPFAIEELLARVEVVLRRYHLTEPEIELEDIHVDQRSHTVSRSGEEISLTPKEYDLLLLFLRNRHVALYRETIYERVWGGDWMGDSRTVDLHVQRLRKKLSWEKKIVPIYKVGYRLEA